MSKIAGLYPWRRQERMQLNAAVSGFLFITIAGVLLHFVYEWSGQSKWVALIGAVNESTWEHMKIALIPACLALVLKSAPVPVTITYICFGLLVALFAACLLLTVMPIRMFLFRDPINGKYGMEAFEKHESHRK